MNILKNEIPKCFHEDIIFATVLMFNREKFVLVIIKDCTLYEIQSLKVLHSINLKEQFKEILDWEDNVQSQFYKNSVESENNITIGKYILNNGISTRLFILVKISDKLVILERITTGYTLAKEFTNVDKFEISDPDKFYQAHVYIFYIGEIISTRISFDDDSVKNKTNDNLFAKDFKVEELVKIIKKERSDLAEKTAVTKKMFLNIKNNETFGCNFIRSHEIEEKLILSRCGDIWMRVHNDFLVIGIPVANNCSGRLTTLQNIRPKLNFNNKNGLEFQYKLYEIMKGVTNFNLDSLDANEISDKTLNMNEEWIPIKIRSLRPASSAIIVITSSLNNFYNLSCNEIICFITYDIFHENHKLTQNLFVNKFKIDTEILYNSQFQLDFSVNSAINFLTIAVTSTQYIFIINFPGESKINCLDNLNGIFMEQLQFKQYEDDKSTEAMEIEDDEQEQSETIKLKIFYKFDCVGGNFWYGTIIILSQLSGNKLKMKIYSRSESKTIALIQLIYQNYTEKIQIFPEKYASTEESIQNFEYALREEINLGAKLTKENDHEETILSKTVFSLHKELFVKELQTDICINHL